MASRIGRHLRSQFVGYIALVLAMSGTAYAIGANSIGDRELARNSVGSSEIEPKSVDANDLAPNSVGDAQLQSGGADCYVGEILQIGFDYAPRGTMPADGRHLPISQFQALYSLYGTKYGGDGKSNFQLPKLTTADGMTSYVVCVNGYYPSRPDDRAAG